MKIGELKWDCKRVLWPAEKGKTENGFTLSDNGDTLTIRNTFYEHAQATTVFSLAPNSEYSFSVEMRVEDCERNPKDTVAYPNIKSFGAYPLFDIVKDGKIIKVGHGAYSGSKWFTQKWNVKTNDTTSYALSLSFGGNCSTCKGTAYFRNLTVERVAPSESVETQAQTEAMPIISDVTFELPCASTVKIRMRNAPAYCMSHNDNGIKTLQLYFNDKTLIAFDEAITLSFFGRRDGNQVRYNDTTKPSLDVFTKPSEVDSIVAVIAADGSFRPVFNLNDKSTSPNVMDVKLAAGETLFYIADVKYYPENKANGYSFTDIREWS